MSERKKQSGNNQKIENWEEILEELYNDKEDSYSGMYWQ